LGSVGYGWAHEQQHYAEACELVERATLTVVDLALALDDINAVRHAGSQGLKALRVNEPLYRARMRVEAHCGTTPASEPPTTNCRYCSKNSPTAPTSTRRRQSPPLSATRSSSPGSRAPDRLARPTQRDQLHTSAAAGTVRVAST
jgi:hypothetical protein